MKRSGLIILGIVAVLVLWVISVRNGLATASTGIDGEWGKVENQYQRKAKLYENLVSTVRGAAKNEDTTLIKIVQMRSRIPNITPDQNNPQQVAQADKQYSDLGRAMLNINIEAYPTLKATELFKDLQTQVEGTENRVTTALGDWNNAITAYNTKLVRFPANMVAGLFGYTKKNNYKADEGAKDAKIDIDK
ncbi:LemA family protein [Ferruginibacter sp. SUN002]|uniref:LemA family protein n=1 Tax=Ferruginibacter sp. SUN002 TaxID=2937789 RepID=UPI003D362786